MKNEWVDVEDWEDTQEQQPMGWVDAAQLAVQNAPKSAATLVENITAPIHSPIQTTKGIASLATGLVDLAIPGEQEDEKTVYAIKDYLVNRYGGIENIKQTFADDPVSLLADVALIASGVGGGIKAAGTVGKLPALSRVGETVSAVSKVIDPVRMAAKGVGVAASGAAKVLPPERLYSSVLKKGKLSDKLTEAQQLQNARVGIENNIIPNRAGLEKIGGIHYAEDAMGNPVNSFSGLLGDAEQKIIGIIDDAANAGKTVSRNDILKQLDELAGPKGPYFHSDQRVKNLRAIDKVKKNIVDAYPDDIPIQDAQKLKQNVQRSLAKSYGNPNILEATTTARKVLGSSVREEVAKIHPDLALLNEKASELISLRKAIEAAIPRLESRDIFGIGAPIKLTAGIALDSATGGSAGKIAAATAAVMEMPQVKARLAIALDKARKIKMQDRGAKAYATREAVRVGQTSKANQQEQFQE